MIQTTIQRPAYPTGRRTSSEAKRQEEPRATLAPQPKARENMLPAAESLATLIRNAIAALKQGHVWDRGSIVNLNI